MLFGVKGESGEEGSVGGSACIVGQAQKGQASALASQAASEANRHRGLAD